MYLALVSSALLYFSGLFIYRLFFHPLRKYPGPTLAALSGGYQAYHSQIKGGEWILEIERLHRIYGPVVRVGPNKLHFNYPGAFHDIYTNGHSLTKDPGMYPHGMAAILSESAWATTDLQKAKYRRSLVTPLFSRRAILELEYTIQQKIDKLLGVFEKHYSSPGSIVDIASAFRSLTTDIITSYCFAECPDTLDHPDFSHPLVQNVEKLFRTFWIQQTVPWIVSLINNVPVKVTLWFLPQFKGYLGLRTRLSNQIDSVRADPDILSNAEHETVYRHIMEAKDKESLTKTQLLHDAIVFQGAGSDTVGNSCYVGTFYALKNPAITRRLVEELQEAWPDKGKPLSYTVLEKLPYLTAFVKETLRFSVGVVHPLARVVGSDMPVIGGLNLPSGTVVEMSAVFMHFNPEVFPDPNLFNPDRWLSGDIADMNRDLVAFGKGPRVCIGVNLAWCELYLIFANLFRKFNIQLVIEKDMIEEFDADQRLDYFVVAWRKGYRVALEKLKYSPWRRDSLLGARSQHWKSKLLNSAHSACKSYAPNESRLRLDSRNGTGGGSGLTVGFTRLKEFSRGIGKATMSFRSESFAVCSFQPSQKGVESEL
ncbi:hypothetical protein D9757_009045 [Collybiopsis confluens]|uniref:Cytochrome P450 n=1 Tax=Collybiopsis confluens TaxID=2823264 RepID=A0A8H5HDM9_9AGAR|nr:hypothetical protein D9757_009045 [Collybiopsis confluens]